jgi:Phosphoserine phosphatase RsbU, N-terminal domain/GAF domain
MSTIAFRAAYASALDAYLRDPGEAELSVAYELARDAVGRRLSVLDLAVAHQEAVLGALERVSDAEQAQEIARAAGDFFLEGLSTFEMVQRGLEEARQTAWLERRHTELSRRLSTFLTDASLALDTERSLEEVLHLVAEQARELVGADCCVATVATQGRPRVAEGCSYAETDRRWPTYIRWLDLFAVYGLLRERGGSARVAADELARLEPFGDQPPQGWLAASLTALDGGELGAIQLFDKEQGAFTADDEAALVHLAQTASAAIERARLYRERNLR